MAGRGVLAALPYLISFFAFWAIPGGLAMHSCGFGGYFPRFMRVPGLGGNLSSFMKLLGLGGKLSLSLGHLFAFILFASLFYKSSAPSP